MKNYDYWKEAYKDLWDESSKKEEALKNLIKKETGLDMIPYGLGAESAEFIHGSAAMNDNEKGAPDYKINNTNIFIEVTGPLTDRAKPERGLWIRPDKLRYAYEHLKENDEIFALFFPSVKEWLIIHADEVFFEDVKTKYKTHEDYIRVYPKIRGKVEKYIEISYNNPFIKDLNFLIDYLKAC